MAARALPGAPRRFLEELAAAPLSDDCVTWPFARANGYGTVHDWRPTSTHRGARKAHQVAWELLRDMPFPVGMHTRHLCGNGDGGCVNPIHVQPGTPLQNSADEDRLGRRIRGERTGTSKLRWPIVDRIKWRLERGDLQIHIAADYGVSASLVRLIGAGKIWQDGFDPRSDEQRGASRRSWLEDCRAALLADLDQIDAELNAAVES